LLKNKDRRNLFECIKSPPDVIITRWSNRLKAAIYYAKNLPTIIEIITKNFTDSGLLELKSKRQLDQKNYTLNR
jgi:hypothetical protein